MEKVKFEGDWGLGIGDWGLGPIPNPHSVFNFFLFSFVSKLNEFIELSFLFIYKL